MSQAKPSAVGKSRRGIDAPTPARVEDCRSRGRPEGDRGEWKASASSGVSRPCCKKSHLGDRRADSGADGGAAAPRGVVLSFEAKESTKESTRHGDSEGGTRRYAPWASACGSPFGAVLGLGSLRSPAGKSPLMPIFERGSSQCRAQHSWIAITSYRARSCSLFSSFKKGKAFSLRCLSPLCSAATWVRAKTK